MELVRESMASGYARCDVCGCHADVGAESERGVRICEDCAREAVALFEAEKDGTG